MDNRLLFLMAKAQHKLKTYIRQEYKIQGIDISPGQTGILFLLFQKDLRKMSELSLILAIDNSAITRLIDKLEKQRLVKRRVNPKDRRQYLIAITEDGKKVAQKTISIAHRVNSMIRKGFTHEEIDTFIRITQHITSTFDMG